MVVIDSTIGIYLKWEWARLYFCWRVANSVALTHIHVYLVGFEPTCLCEDLWYYLAAQTKVSGGILNLRPTDWKSSVLTTESSLRSNKLNQTKSSYDIYMAQTLFNQYVIRWVCKFLTIFIFRTLEFSFLISLKKRFSD